MDVDKLLDECKKHIRIVDNYNIPEKEKIAKIKRFLFYVINFEFEHIKILDDTLQSVFDVLCSDIIRQSRMYIKSETMDSIDGRNLLNIIRSMESYLKDVSKMTWEVGKKISTFEQFKLRHIFRKTFHSEYDLKTNRPVRGTRARVELTGSLVTGYSNWKVAEQLNVPKPSDYGIVGDLPPETKDVIAKVDKDLDVPYELKKHFSDVDILIQNEVVFDSINPRHCHVTKWPDRWSYKLGEKYTTGTGESNIMAKLHQKLITVKIAGIRGRLVNYIIIRDDKSYGYLMKDRHKLIDKSEQKLTRRIKVEDVPLLDEVIR